METETNATHNIFIKTSDVYYYGDHLTGDLMLGRCLKLLTKLFAVPTERALLLDIVSKINQARELHDFTALADILRYEVAPHIKAISDR
ncbi:hypothetical protein ATG66_1034 [Vibrio sp. ES.051]|uniref:hypothetical protein n=1 Tax=Vibrio sp. ES.051 TaxID=1761909 RepID=UPI000BF8F827|nr:hypothetical protein [Vibrio sp. ES.051]PFG58484.1 hypothetical protein ATG66_1034 [Vibrio sp. ES.051]